MAWPFTVAVEFFVAGACVGCTYIRLQAVDVDKEIHYLTLQQARIRQTTVSAKIHGDRIAVATPEEVTATH